MWSFLKRLGRTNRIARPAANRRPRLNVEALEERLALSWGGVPPVSILPPSSAVALNLNSQGDAQGSAAITSSEIDYYAFLAPTSGAYRINATTPSSNMDTVLGVFNASGQRVAYNDDISFSNWDSQLTVSLNAGQRYYFGITNYAGSVNGGYSWMVDGPAAAIVPADDAYEQNDTLSQAYNLGTVSSSRTITGLVLRNSDWFRFTLSRAGAGDSFVSISFTHALGDVDIRLYDSRNQQVGSSTGVGDNERISLNGLAAGTYYFHVYGYNGATNPRYSLTVNPSVALAVAPPVAPPVTPPVVPPVAPPVVPPVAPPVVPPVAPPAVLPDDSFEDNDTLGQASNLGTLTSSRTTTGLILRDSADWFRFTTTGTGAGDSAVSIDFAHAQGNLELQLYNGNGEVIRSSASLNNGERISLAGLAAGTYSVRIFGAMNPSYSLTVNPTILPPDDAYEDNDTLAQAYNLGILSSQRTIAGLAMVDGGDWFCFTTTGVGASSSSVGISFLQSQGNLDLELYNPAGQLVRSSSNGMNGELISLSGLASGTYYVRIFGAINPNYSLAVNPAVVPPPPPPPPPPPAPIVPPGRSGNPGGGRGVI